MKKKLLKKARKLAARPYEVQFVPDFDTDGNPVFFARIPEMPGCVAHGDTIEEAKEWIELAKVDFIYFYLEDGLAPPEPAGFKDEDIPQFSVLELSEELTESETITFSNSRFRTPETPGQHYSFECVFA